MKDKARQRAQESMSVDSYRGILEVADEGVWVINGDAITLYVNTRMARMLGLSADEMLGRPVREFLFDQDRELGAKGLSQGLAPSHCGVEKRRYRRQDGSALWAQVRVHALAVPEGTPPATVGFFTEVTGRRTDDRRSAVRELDRVRQRLQGVFDDSTVGQAMFEAEPPYRVLTHNRIYQDYWDEPFRSQGMTGRGIAEYVPDAEANGILEIFREVAATGLAQTLYEFSLVGLARGRTYWHWHLSPVVREGRLAAFSHTLIEVTGVVHGARELEKRVAEIAGELHWELETLQSIMDNIPVMLVFYDRNGRFGLLNRACERALGWSSEELRDKDLMELAYPDPRYRREVWEFMRRAEPGWRDFVVRTRAGSNMESAWANVRLSDGSQIGIGIDITERKGAEEDLRRSEQRLALALEASRAGVFEYDLTTDEHSYQNPRLLEMLEYAAEDIPRGRRFRSWLLERVHPEDRARLEEAFCAVESGAQEELNEEVSVRCGSGRYVPVHLQARPLFRKTRTAAAATVGVVRDLTARKRMERELEEGRRVAERRAQELQRLALELTESEENERRRVGRILHDELQQYLVAAKLKLSGLDSATKGQLLELARETTELLDHAISASRTLSSELSSVVLYNAGLAAGLQWLGEWMERQHGLRVEVRADPAAEPQSDGLRILLFQVARELLLNVVKHSGVKEAKASLSREEGNQLILRVVDRGQGFDPSTLQRPETGGRGFGLLSVSERVQLLAGRIRIVSAPGEGTAVTVRLPDRFMWTEDISGSVADAALSAGPGKGGSAANGSRPIRLLIAEDHTVVRQGFVSIMRRNPYVDVVGLASDGEMAVRLARSLKPDVVLMDVSMPKMSGIEATRRIHATHPQIRIIGLSIHDQKESRAAMLEAGAVEYVTKDGPAELLLAAIQSAGHRASRAANRGS